MDQGGDNEAPPSSSFRSQTNYPPDLTYSLSPGLFDFARHSSASPALTAAYSIWKWRNAAPIASRLSDGHGFTHSIPQ